MPQGADVPIAYRLYHWLWAGIDALYPPCCGGCGELGTRWCSRCREMVAPVSQPVCDRCGDSIEGPGLCINCQRVLPAYKLLRSYATFEGSIRNILHRLKYKRDLGLGEILAEPLSHFFTKLNWPIDMVVPVPLAKNRMKRRGYNQAFYIAKPFALYNRLDFQPSVVVRVRETVSQVGLTAVQRRENMKDAFRIVSQKIKNKNILIIDDVATTGSTIDACAKAMLQEGTNEVYALTVARALIHRDGVTKDESNMLAF